MKKLLILIRYTDLCHFSDCEGPNQHIRLQYKTRGRPGPVGVIEGEVEDVLKRALAVVGAGLPETLRPAFEREMASS